MKKSFAGNLSSSTSEQSVRSLLKRMELLIKFHHLRSDNG